MSADIIITVSIVVIGLSISYSIVFARTLATAGCNIDTKPDTCVDVHTTRVLVVTAGRTGNLLYSLVPTN